MTCFILFTLAATLGVPGPARGVHVNRAQVVTVRAVAPSDPQRPSARAIVRLEGGGVLYLVEAPDAVVRAPCAAGSLDG